MAQQDYYKILGVDRKATDADIKKAHRRLVRKYHPDRNPNDTKAAEQFKKVQEAYEVLFHPEKRQQYDQTGHAGPGGFPGAGEWRSAPGGRRVYTWSGNAGGQPFDTGGGGGGGGDMGDIFEQFFAGRARPGAAPRGRPAAQPGQDLEHKVRLSFEEAARGCTRRVTLQKPGGKAETIEIKIPAGVEDGKKIRIRGKGQPSLTGGPPGNLYIIPHIRSHAWFRREGADVYLDLPVSLGQAVLGAQVEIPTLDGSVKMKIPPGTNGGRTLRLAGKGIKNPKTGKTGDQYVVVHIVVPTDLSKQEKEWIEKIETKHAAEVAQSRPW